MTGGTREGSGGVSTGGVGVGTFEMAVGIDGLAIGDGISSIEASSLSSTCGVGVLKENGLVWGNVVLESVLGDFVFRGDLAFSLAKMASLDLVLLGLGVSLGASWVNGEMRSVLESKGKTPWSTQCKKSKETVNKSVI